MGLFERYGIDIDYIIVGMLVLQVVLIVMIIIHIARHKKLKIAYENFMKGSDGNTLESSIITRFKEIDQLKDNYLSSKKQLDEIRDNLNITFQKMAVIKYDAFKEMGGKLSFSLCLLDDNNDGWILTSMHSSREGCYTYVKEIIKGESFVILSEEEKQVLVEAKNKYNSIL